MHFESPLVCKNFIGGEFVDADNDQIKSFNYATGELVGTAPESSVDIAKEAAEGSARPFESTDWTSNPVARSKALYSLSLKIDETRSELVELLVKDAGKTIRDAQLELNVCIDTLEY